jgi:photosystem II stability/assembly factor-like uncharacterized protein
MRNRFTDRACVCLLAWRVLAVAAPVAAADGANVWTAAGPPGEIVRQLTFDPQRGGVVYAGTETGLFKSIDAGLSWHPTGLDSPISQLAIDPTDRRNLYVAAGGTGISRSIDGGDTWTSALVGGYTVYAEAVAVDPRHPTTVYAGTTRYSGSYPTGVFRSDDRGQTWQATGLANDFVFTLVIAPGDPSILFARSSGSLVRSLDGGATWQRRLIDGDFNRSFDCDVVIDPAAPAVVYAGTDYVFQTGSALWTSGDRGDSWVALTGGLAVPSTCALALDPQTPSTIYTADGQTVLKSTNGGVTWAPISPALPGPPPPPLPPPVLHLIVDPAAPQRLYAVTGNGLYRLDQSALFQCGGDCNGDDRLTVDELVAGVGIALGTRPLTACPRFDHDGSGAVTIDELSAAVGAALDTCLPIEFPLDESGVSGFEFTRGPADGFCPPLDAVYDAQLLINEAGSYDFYHDTLEAGVPGVDTCVPGLLGAGDCPVVRPHPVRSLSAAEADLVRKAFAGVTMHSRPVPSCGAADPCVVNSFRWDRLTLTDSPCSDRRIDAAQSTALAAMLQVLHGGSQGG